MATQGGWGGDGRGGGWGVGGFAQYHLILMFIFI